MDVTCERCSTEYEFDDALVSERGTTVKCTNCGYQFKVRRTDGALPEKWVVRTVDGRELEFKMLRELQSAIAQAEITRDDVISRGSSRPRRLGSIAELEPFFTSPKGALMSSTANGLGGPSPPGRVRSVTPKGLGGPPPAQTEGSVAIPLPRQDDVQDRAPESSSDSETVVMDVRQGQVARARVSARGSAAPPARSALDVGSLRRAATVPGPLPGVVVPPEEAPPLPNGFVDRRSEPRPSPRAERRHGSVRPARDASAELTTLPAGMSPLPTSGEPAVPHVEVVSAPGLGGGDDDAPTRPGALRAAERSARRSSTMQPLVTPTSDARPSYFEDGYGDPRFTSLAPSRRTGVARWIVGLIVLGLGALSAVTLGSKFLSTTAPVRTQATDERIPTLLNDGERSLGDGDFETARDKFVKASALAENDPRVAESLARLETVGADTRWLRVQLLAPDDPDLEVARQELKSSIERARKAVEHARRLSPTDAAATRAAIDLLRIEGDLGGARKLVGSISAASAQPESALTLAALDLAEAQPSWAAVLERLRTAASSEKSLGRARALLVYALARAGDVAGAKAEHERLVAMSRPHPLARALRVFIERLEKTQGKLGGDAGAAAPGAGASPSTVKTAPRSPSSPEAGEASADPTPGTRSPERPHDGRVPDDYVAPGGTIDTSDLPGVGPPPTTPSPPPAKTPSSVDTSDLPGSKP
jgi:predicted Zn finger-like uncharacterized protein